MSDVTNANASCLTPIWLIADQPAATAAKAPSAAATPRAIGQNWDVLNRHCLLRTILCADSPCSPLRIVFWEASPSSIVTGRRTPAPTPEQPHPSPRLLRRRLSCSQATLLHLHRQIPLSQTQSPSRRPLPGRQPLLATPITARPIPPAVWLYSRQGTATAIMMQSRTRWFQANCPTKRGPVD